MKVIEITQKAIEKEMKKAVENSNDYQEALSEYATCFEKKTRIKEAIKQLTDEEASLQEEKQQLTTNFGDQDPLADTDRLEAINNRITAINESKRLLEKRTNAHYSNLTREMEDLVSEVKHSVLMALPEIRRKYQNEVDRQVETLIATVHAYNGALSCLSRCKTSDGKHNLQIGLLPTARIEIQDSYRLHKIGDL